MGTGIAASTGLPDTLRRLVVALAIFLLAVHPGAARAQEEPFTSEHALAAGALFVGAVLLDPVVDGVVRQGGGHRWEWASDALNHGGRPEYAVAGLGVLWLGGRIADAPALSSAALHVGVALATAGVVNGALKYVIGRERPIETDDPTRFRPFSPENRWQSFPSGHTVVAFSLAAALSAEAEHPAVSILTYATACLVGWSRIYEDKHWASDVVGGAVVGMAASRMVLSRLHRRPRRTPQRTAITLWPGGVAIELRTP